MKKITLRNKLSALLPGLLIAFTAAACGGGDSKNVYIASSIATSNWESTGGYWDNGTWNEFASTYSKTGTGMTRASSIAISGSDVYVGGESADSSNNLNMAGYWKNGTWVELVNKYDPTYKGQVNSIAVADGKVYVGGCCYNGTINVAGYWVSDGSATVTWIELNTYNTGTASYKGQVNSIAVAGGKVYAIGLCDNGTADVAGFWVSDGSTKTWTGFTNIYNSECGVSADSIAVADGKIYAAGYCYNGTVCIAGYWVSDGSASVTWVELPNTYNTTSASYEGGVNSIVVADGKVYAGGYCNNGSIYVAGYWVSDGSTKTWTGFANPYGASMTNIALSIAISGSDLYLAATPVSNYNEGYQRVGYYKNGRWTELNTGHSLTDYPNI